MGVVYHGSSPSQRGSAARRSPAVVATWPERWPGMGTVYREKVSDERHRAVCEHVRGWLFGK